MRDCSRVISLSISHSCHRLNKTCNKRWWWTNKTNLQVMKTEHGDSQQHTRSDFALQLTHNALILSELVTNNGSVTKFWWFLSPPPPPPPPPPPHSPKSSFQLAGLRNILRHFFSELSATTNYQRKITPRKNTACSTRVTWQCPKTEN